MSTKSEATSAPRFPEDGSAAIHRVNVPFERPVYPQSDMRHLTNRATRLMTMNLIARQIDDMEARAMAIAAFAHGNQARKYSNAPYFVHLMEVRNTVAGLPGTTKAQRTAAVMHDSVEDGFVTGILLEDVQGWFGDEVTELVDWLTDVSRPEDGSRAQRRAKDLQHSAQAPEKAQTIKSADVKSNTGNSDDMIAADPAFAAIYLPEKLAQLNALDKADPELREQALANVRAGLTKLGKLSTESQGIARPRSDQEALMGSGRFNLRGRSGPFA